MQDEVFAIRKARQVYTLHNADCISGMRDGLEKGSVDVVVTSPPYNLGTAYKAYDDSVPRREYLDWLEEWVSVVRGVLHDEGSLFLNIGAKPSDPTVPFEVLARMQNHLKLQNVIHWVKSIAIEKEAVGNYPGITGNIAVGHYKPINSPRYLSDCHEYVFHLTKRGDVKLDRLAVGVEYQDKSNIGRWKSAKQDRRCRGNTWFVPYTTIRSRDKQRPHPATFPVELPRMCARLHGLDRTNTVMDPFLGIGTAAVACVDLGVDFIGFETDHAYFQEARRRLEEALEGGSPNAVSDRPDDQLYLA